MTRLFVEIAARSAALVLAVALAACGVLGDREPNVSQPSFYRNLAAGGELDANGAAAMISNYRTNNSRDSGICCGFYYK